MTRTQTLAIVTVILTSSQSTGISAAESVAVHPRVPGFERFFRADGGDLADGGRLLASELNCRACHAGERTNAQLTDKQAPILDQVGDRVRPEWIREFLSQPHVVKPGTTMPNVLAALPESERQAQVEALTHFLASTGAAYDAYADPAAARRGRSLFARVGCAACHDPVEGDRPALATSAPLPDLGKKYTSHSLATFLKDPLKTRPSGRMPALGLKDEEYQDLAQYFLRDQAAIPNVSFSVYLGSWDKLPDFSTLEPEQTGECAGFDLSVAGRPNNFAIQFRTNLFMQAEGDYTFILGSDDGSRLLIDGEMVVDIDGVHPHQEERKSVHLTAGWHPVVVEYFQGGGEWTLAVDLQARGVSRRAVASLSSLKTDKPLSEQGDNHFVVNPDLAARGRTLFAEVGCANCHSLKWDERKIAPTRMAKAWDELAGRGGCLQPTPTAGLPSYGFDERQRAALVAARAATPATSTPSGDIHTTLLTLNCYACHQRGEQGGVEEARNRFFTSSQQEMGDEGRLPPTLTGVGDKLRDEWLKKILDQGANDRQQYMHARMPKFGGQNVGQLTAALIQADRQPDSFARPEFTEPDYRIKADGRHLVGAKALSCIKCHDFAQHPAQGVRAINLATMTLRLREDWFYRYMLNPQDFRPGTRMPAPWPFGQTTIRDVLDADVNKQIHAVWTYLADGDKGAVPVGLVREPIELAATTTPIIYRNFIDGAGSRGIGVGYPELLNIAWDANDMRLALIWHGAFIDASRHWNGRGVGFEAPLGDDVLPLPAGQPLAQLGSSNDSWPEGLAREHGFRFRGYRLDSAKRPTLTYTVGELTVDDYCEPVLVEGKRFPNLLRTLTISGPASDLPWYFRAATASRLAPTRTPGGWMVDDTWSLIVDPAITAQQRESGGRKELLLPVKLTGEKLTFQLHYEW